MEENPLSWRDRVSETEEIILGYIVKHNHRIRISECAIELGLSFSEAENAIKSLNAKGLLNVFQKPKVVGKDIRCEYLRDGRCRVGHLRVGIRDSISLREHSCKNAIQDACCYLCPHRGNCNIACDILDQDSVDKIQEGLPERVPTLSELYDTRTHKRDPVSEFGLGLVLVIFTTIVLIVILPPLSIIALIAGASGALYCFAELIWNLATKRGE